MVGPAFKILLFRPEDCWRQTWTSKLELEQNKLLLDRVFTARVTSWHTESVWPWSPAASRERVSACSYSAICTNRYVWAIEWVGVRVFFVWDKCLRLTRVCSLPKCIAWSFCNEHKNNVRGLNTNLDKLFAYLARDKARKNGKMWSVNHSWPHIPLVEIWIFP